MSDLFKKLHQNKKPPTNPPKGLPFSFFYFIQFLKEKDKDSGSEDDEENKDDFK